MPSCFGSTMGSSAPKYRAYEDAQDGSSGKRTGRRKQNTLGGSLFQSTIMKTVDTKVEESKEEEDAVRLVQLKKKEGASVDEISTAPESLYKAQHKETLPKDW